MRRRVNAFRAAGGRVIGYVYSSDGSRPLAQITADIDRYATWYGIDGIFVDEMANTGPAQLLFIPGAVAIPWDPGYGFVHYERAVEWAREATRDLAITAGRVGVELCIENVWNGLFYSPLEYRDFINSIDSSAIGAYFDVGNCMGQHQYPPHWIEILGLRIKRVHLKDFQRSIGTLDGFCDLLQGDQPWVETMTALRAIGYDRTLTAEMIPYAPGRVEKTGHAMRRIVRM